MTLLAVEGLTVAFGREGSAIPAIENVLAQLRARGSVAHLQDQLATPQHIARIAGLEAYHALEARYGPAGDAAALE